MSRVRFYIDIEHNVLDRVRYYSSITKNPNECAIMGDLVAEVIEKKIQEAEAKKEK